MHDRLIKSSSGKMTAVAAPTRDVCVVMPTISWTGSFEPCARRVLELIEGSECDAELVVVLDGEAMPPPDWLVRPDVQVVSTGVRSGPAVARNRASASSRSEVLFFVDADVELADGAIDLVHRRFKDNEELDALFGAYDDEPLAPSTVSQFRNLLHHHVHMLHPGRATTFWSGCGAIRTAYFRTVGGFDGRYAKPSIEDIELGVRMTSLGGRIELDPTLQCKHHKCWTMRSMIHTDVACRAIPWTRLMMRKRHVPACLAIDHRNRASGFLSLAAVTGIVPAIFFPWLWLAVASCLAGVFLLNNRFYRLCRRKRGLLFSASAFALHVLFFVYSTLTFAGVVLHSMVARVDGEADGSPNIAELPPAAPVAERVRSM